jgi:SAM-dependent methyltransferase
VLDELAGPRILSFGCSTGDEPLTLTRYCPRAMIDAIEINPRSLVIARDKAKAQGCTTIAFHLSGDPPETGAYDAIFCLSVLRHGELDAISPERCSEILPFARFDQTLVAFDRVLRTGGYLYLWGSNFRFADSRIAQRYSAIPVPGAPPHHGAIYGPDDRFMHSNGNAFFVFRKERGYPGDGPSTIAKAPQPA